MTGHELNPAEVAFNLKIGPDDPARGALIQRFGELKELQAQGDPAFQPGSRFFKSKTGSWVERVLGLMTGDGDDDGERDPTGVGGRSLTFAQTEAGVRLAASLARGTERDAARLRVGLEDTLHELAVDLLPPADVETAMHQVRSNRVVKSKLAFQAVLQNLADAAQNAQRRADLDLQEENERRTLTEARSRITVDMIGRDLGAAILFALGAGDSGGNE